MDNDLPVNHEEQNPEGAIDHIAYAFIAAKNGDHDFLEALLGPSIPSEKRQYEKLLADIQTYYDKIELWEFRRRLAERKLAMLKNFKGGVDVVLSINTQLRACAADEIQLSVDAWSDRCGVHSLVYYNATQSQFPTLDAHDHMHGYSPNKMGDFFASLGITKPDAQAYYCISLSQETKAALRDLLVARYERQAERVDFDIKEISEVSDYLDHLGNSIDAAQAEIDRLSAQKRPISDQIAQLNDVNYNVRKQRFRDLVAKFEANPELLPLVYRVPSPELGPLLKSARVPVDARNKDGNTLLQVAAEAKKYNVVRLLLDHDADLSVRNGINAPPVWELAGLHTEAELRSLAKVYKRRNESRFLADVNKDFQAYKKAHEDLLKSYKRYLHTEKRLQERSEQLANLEAGIQKAKTVPIDDILVLDILTLNLLATRGSLGRSGLFDPLVARVKRYTQEKGYGVTRQDIIEVLNGEVSASVNAELERVTKEKDARIELLEAELRSSELKNTMKDSALASMSVQCEEKDAEISKQRHLLSEKDKAIEWYQSKVNELSDKFLEQVKSSEHAARQIEMLTQAVAQLSGRFQQQSGGLVSSQPSDPIVIDAPVSISQANAALFNRIDSSESGRFHIPTGTLEDTSTSNRPNQGML